MSNINSVTISGNITRDPELRATKTGTSVLNFSVAVNDTFRNKATDKWEDYANFFDCVVMGKRADALKKILAKGTKVCVSGKLHYSAWEDKDGKKHNKVDIMANEVEIMPRPKDKAEDKDNDGSGDYYDYR